MNLEKKWIQYRIKRIFEIINIRTLEEQRQFVKKNASLVTYSLLVTPELLSYYPEMHQEVCSFSIFHNSNIPLTFFLNHLEYLPINICLPNYGQDYYLSKHPQLTWEIVQSHPEVKWYYDELSKNSNITWDIIQANPDKPWNYKYIGANPSVTWDIIQHHSHLPWDFEYVSSNPNITMEIIQKNPQYHWNYRAISAYGNVTLQEMSFNLECKHIYLQCNPHLQIQKDIEVEYETFIMRNPNITFEFVERKMKHLSSNWFFLHNDFLYEKKLFLKQATLYEKVLFELRDAYFHPRRYFIFMNHDHF